MGNSAISTPTFQALASNIKNADASTPIYGAGAWDFKNATGTTTLAVSSAGAVTVGLSAFTINTRHQINGQMATYATGAVTVTTSATDVIDFTGKIDGMYLVTAVRNGANIGNNGLWYVGVSAGTPIIYATLFSTNLTASVVGNIFKLASSGTHTIYTNALRLVGGS